jgi:hypothetical protein
MGCGTQLAAGTTPLASPTLFKLGFELAGGGIRRLAAGLLGVQQL